MYMKIILYISSLFYFEIHHCWFQTFLGSDCIPGYCDNHERPVVVPRLQIRASVSQLWSEKRSKQWINEHIHVQTYMFQGLNSHFHIQDKTFQKNMQTEIGAVKKDVADQIGLISKQFESSISHALRKQDEQMSNGFAELEQMLRMAGQPVASKKAKVTPPNSGSKEEEDEKME